ncbi:MAG: hypothetical protein AABW58_04560 [Nanoarchaeota archaeon]
MAPLEIISFLFALLILVKLVFVIFSKQTWYRNVAMPIYKNPKVSSLVILIIALIIFYYLIQSITLIELFAAMAFTNMITALSFMFYTKEFSELVKKVYSKNFKFTIFGILYLLFWILLSLKVIYKVLF